MNEPHQAAFSTPRLSCSAPSSITSRTAVYGPACTVVWDDGSFSACNQDRDKRACWRCHNCGTSLFQQIECRCQATLCRIRSYIMMSGASSGFAPDLRSSSPKCSPAAQRLAVRRWALLLQLCSIAITNGAKEFADQPRYFTVLGRRPFIPMARQ